MNMSLEVDVNRAPKTGAQHPPDWEATGIAGRTLEAMRLGVVPQGTIDPYTVGRDTELAQVHADLQLAKQKGGAVRAFLGGYGAGKTHLLELIGERALAENFLVTKVVLNPQETSPSHPKRVYRDLIRSLQYPDDTDGPGTNLGVRSLHPLFERAIASPAALSAFQVNTRGKTRDFLDAGAHLYLSPALRYFRQITDDPDLPEDQRAYALNLLFDWLEGHPTISTIEINEEFRHILGNKGHIYSMKDYRPWARIYGYLLSGLSALARHCGYNGLVVLVDEAEFYSLLSNENREYARNLFKALAWASVGDRGAMLPFSPEELNIGGLGILQRLPPQYGTHLWAESTSDPDESDDSDEPDNSENAHKIDDRRPQDHATDEDNPPELPGPGMYTIFAMTPNIDGLEALDETIPPDQIGELTALSLEHYQELVSRVFNHYHRARPEAQIDRRMVGALGKVIAGFLTSGYIENPRQAMKFLVEFLDLGTHCPGEMKQVVQDLRSISP